MGTFGFSREDDFDTLIYAAATEHGVDPLLVKAVIATESGFDPQAYRAEPRLGDASRGLMQILLGTAQWMGYSGEPEGLFDPETNVTYGVKYLAYQMRRYGDRDRAIAAYNAGSATPRADGTYANQAYVDRVLAFYRGYLAAQPLPEAAQEAAAEQGTEAPPETSLGPVEGNGDVTVHVPVEVGIAALAVGLALVAAARVFRWI